MEKIAGIQLKLREALTKSTDTPLKFFVHIPFIAELGLILLLWIGMVTKFDTTILFYMFLAIIGLPIVAMLLVFILVARFPKNLTYNKESHLMEGLLTSYGTEKTEVLDYAKLLMLEHTSPSQLLESAEKDKEENG